MLASICYQDIAKSTPNKRLAFVACYFTSGIKSLKEMDNVKYFQTYILKNI